MPTFAVHVPLSGTDPVEHPSLLSWKSFGFVPAIERAPELRALPVRFEMTTSWVLLVVPHCWDPNGTEPVTPLITCSKAPTSVPSWASTGFMSKVRWKPR